MVLVRLSWLKSSTARRMLRRQRLTGRIKLGKIWLSKMSVGWVEIRFLAWREVSRSLMGWSEGYKLTN